MINHSGIGVYIRYYIDFIISTEEFNITLIGNSNLIKSLTKNLPNVYFIECNYKIYSLSELIFFPFLIPDCDIYWSPHYNAPIFPIKAKKILITIPDIAHISMASIMRFNPIKRLYARFRIMMAMNNSDWITTISEFSKNEICKTKNVSNKISTIHLGIDLEIFNDSFKNNEILEKYNLPENYILFVGNVKPHKNLFNLVKAFELITTIYPEIYLIIVGKKEGFITGDINLIKYMEENTSLKDKIRFTGYVDDHDLPNIYKHAKVFAFPSLYEGFGFPPLEAMASGCPVASSNAASIPEICGESVLYFNPLDPKDICETINRFIENGELRQEFIKKGLEHVKKFNWQNSSNDFLNVIKSL